MAMFGTTHGAPATFVSVEPIDAGMPSGGSPSAGERTHPVATNVLAPNAQPIK